jgi:predicted PurR-regulated permease PerM
MLGIDARSARAAWTVFLVGLVIYLTYAVRRTLLIFTAALLFSYLLAPVVDRIDKELRHKRSRTIALAVVYLVLLALLVTAGALVGGAVVSQASTLAAHVPDLVKRISDPSSWPVPVWLESRREELTAALPGWIEEHAKDVVPVVQRAGFGLLSVLTDLPFLVLVPILSFFMLKDGSEILAAFLEMLPEGPVRAASKDILRDVHVLLLQFIRATVILCVLTFLVYMTVFVVAGVPYPVLLAAIAGALEFLPFVGPLSAAVIIVVVSGFSGFGGVLWLVVFFLVYRLFQDYVIQPYLMSSGIALHPLLVIFGVIAGEQIGGIAGMFLSIPVLATLRIVFVRMRRQVSLAVPA